MNTEMSPKTSTTRSSAAASSVTVSLNCFRIELGDERLARLGRRRLAVPLEEVLLEARAAVAFHRVADDRPHRVHGRAQRLGNGPFVVPGHLDRRATERREPLARIGN